MIKYFYTTPLAAAWMANYFGMRFSPELDGYNSLINHLKNSVEKFYIKSHSLELLKPQSGDLWIPYPDAIVEEYNGNAVYRNDYKIIQRNGIPFMWPENEIYE